MTTATLTISERYEMGRSDGYADGCILWRGGTGGRGYGYVQHEGRRQPVHRVAWLKAGRKIPADHALHHKCGNRRCVNLDHLQPLTHSAHALIHHPRQEVCGRCGSDDWRIQRDGSRSCRPCARITDTKRRRHRYQNDAEARVRQLARQAAWKRDKRRRDREARKP